MQDSATAQAIFTISAVAPVNHKPIGFLDNVDAAGIANGWSYDPDDASKPVEIHFYIDGTGQANLAGYIKADQPRPEHQQNNLSRLGNHGFSWSIPDSYKNGNPHIYMLLLLI